MEKEKNKCSTLVDELNTALAMVSTISVSHDAVDVMAAAKQKIRKVIAELDKPPVDAENNQKNGA